jgi:hypothetical protein
MSTKLDATAAGKALGIKGDEAPFGGIIPWSVIIQWIVTNGFPIVLNLLTLLLPLLLGKKITLAQAEQYAITYFAWVAEGSAPPPPPVPGT